MKYTFGHTHQNMLSNIKCGYTQGFTETNFSVTIFSGTFGLNPFLNKPCFLCVCSKSLLKTLREKEKLLVKSNFSFSPSVFVPILRTTCHFHQIRNCRLQSLSVWKSLKFVPWERVNSYVCSHGQVASYLILIILQKLIL